MKKLTATLAASLALLGAMAIAPSASAEFGIAEFDGIVSDRDGTVSTQAGAHPASIVNYIEFNTIPTEGGLRPEANVKDIYVDLPVGIAGNPTVTPKCSEEQLMADLVALCPPNTQVGMAVLELNFSEFNPGSITRTPQPIYNMEVPAGTPSSFGFNVLGVGAHLTSRLRSDSDYGISIDSLNTNETLPVVSAKIKIWGVPADPANDIERCVTPNITLEGDVYCTEPKSVSTPPVPMLTNPTDCSSGPGVTVGRADSWPAPGVFDVASFLAHDTSEPPVTVSTTGCEKVPFGPEVEALPTNDSAEGPTGLNYELSVPTDGLLNPTGRSQANVKRVTVTLPEGMTVNPSSGEGLGVCTTAQFNGETPTSAPGAGCPNNSKIGNVKIQTPLLEEEMTGGLFIAKPYENQFGSLLALYMVAKVPDRGIVIRMAGEIEPDPQTGRLVTTFDDLPQLPFSNFTLNFREGQRSPLVTPGTCGTYAIKTELVPWSAIDPDKPLPSEVEVRDTEFKVTEGPGGAACQAGGLRPFKPGMEAGTLNNQGGSFSPFYVRMSRQDGEQEITKFSADLPPGLSGRLAGIPYCPDAAIARAGTRTGIEELNDPSCPAASKVGRTMAGAGVGTVLAYAPGSVYLAGPYRGSPISIAAITSATVGPFDLGTVVVRSALKVDPDDAQVHVDSSGSDPLPRILKGVPLHLREIRVYMDRPDFTLNPTNCNPFAVTTLMGGSGAEFGNPADDVTANVDQRFQAANCAGLGFGPKLSLRFKGKTHRGANPALTAVLQARKGDANIGRAVVTLPKTEFLDQAHIRTICTRVQYEARTCPQASIYGYAKAWSPLLDKPLEGPVYLRANGGERELPDLVASLDGQFHVDLVGYIDSVNERIRNRFVSVPDAPVTKFVLKMKGGSKGLLVHNTEVCKAKPRATAAFTGQNGKRSVTNPLVKVSCGKGSKRRK